MSHEQGFPDSRARLISPEIMSCWDASLVRQEVTGFQLEWLPETPSTLGLFQFTPQQLYNTPAVSVSACWD